MAEPEAAAAGRPGELSILFVGDIVGGIGRRTLLDCLPVLRERYAPEFVVVNGENAAGGLGITPKIADELIAAGVDAITLGNHTYHRREIYPYLDAQPRIVRPFNFLRSQPGRGVCVVERDGVRLGVVNLSGNLYLRAGRCAFTEIEVALGELTDVGMTGPRGGVIGVKREQAVQSLLTQMPVRFETSEEDPWLMGALVSCSRRLRADSIEQVLMQRPA